MTEDRIGEWDELLLLEEWRDSIPALYRPRPPGDARKLKAKVTSERGSIIAPWHPCSAWPAGHELRDAA